jgi:hypothetical protein
MTSIPKLRHEHFRLMTTVRRLGAIIERKAAPPQLHLRALHHELAATLNAHLKAEDSLLYPPLLASLDRQVASTARAFSDEMGGLAFDYQMHCEKWTGQMIATDWGGYCLECRLILDALTIRITRENRELYPLVEALACAA